MKFFTLKKNIGAMMLAMMCTTVYAEQKQVTLTEAGTISTHILDAEKFTITDLKVSGPINGTDILFLRQMAGRTNTATGTTEGKLTQLDLADANIVAGGDNYFSIRRGMSSIYYKPTATDVVEAYMFAYCNKLTTIKLPKGITSIKNYAFYGCSALTECDIPTDVTAIGDYAFASCSSLLSVDIPEATTSIGSYAFKGCSSLATLTFDENSTIEIIRAEAFMGASALTSVTLPASVTQLAKNAFNGCTSLTTFNFSENLERIETTALAKCTSLTTLSTLPASLNYIAEDAFLEDPIKAYSVNNNNEDFEAIDGVLYNKDDNSELILYPAGRTDEEFTIPGSVGDISSYAFAYAKNLKRVIFNNDLSTIGSFAFAHTLLTELYLKENVAAIGASAFTNCGELTKVVFQSPIQGIEARAFNLCPKLAGLYFLAETTAIPEFGQYVITSRVIKPTFYVQAGNVDKYKEAIDKNTAVMSGEYDVIALNETTGISEVEASVNVTETARYDAMGRRIVTPTKGLNIIRMSDGSVVKVFIK